jgi:hypothetical protein
MESENLAFQNLSASINESFSGLLDGMIIFLPKLIVSILIIIVGWLIGALISKAVNQLVKALRVDKALEAAGAKELVRKGGFELNSGVFIGELIKWFVIVVSFVTVFDIMGLEDVNIVMRGLLSYIPQVISAVLILLVAAVVAPALQKTVVASAKAAGFASASLLGAITKWSIWGFGFLAALFQLNIAATFIQTLFTGLIVALSLGLGISFGLGGKEAAKDCIDNLRREAKD